MQRSNRHPRAHRIRAGVQWWPLSLAVAVVGGLAWYGANSAGWLKDKSQPALEGAKVQRGPLHISVTARGNLKAADSVSLKSAVEGRTAILSLAPQGTHVKEGDIVCELDATNLVEKRFQQSIAASNAEASYVKAKQNYDIQQSQNRSDIARAQQKLEFAKQDVSKFLEGERAFEHEKSQQAIDLAKEDAARASDKLAWSAKLAEKGFLTTTELEADRSAQHHAQVALEQATRSMELLDRFQSPRKLDELNAAFEEAKREAERVALQADARIVDYAADMRTSQARFDLEKEKLALVTSQIEKARMRAPSAGMVIYTQRDSDEPPIQEGAEVREREEILTIPSAGGMIVQAKLHETVVKQVQIGSKCVLKVDALGAQEFAGRVSFVSVLPDQNMRWFNPNTRVYATDITVDAPNDDMRPGMSCSIEIQIEDLPDALLIPVQAAFRTEKENVSFVVRNGVVDRRAVQIGRYNALWVQVLAGLSEGETVLLSAPPGFDRITIESEDEKEGAHETKPKTGEVNTSEASASTH